MKKRKQIVRKYRVAPGSRIKLADYATDDRCDYKKKEGKALLKDYKEQMRELQERLYADDSHSLLLIFQAMDAAGKDGAIKHVMGGINPQGCQVYSFKQPSKVDYEHDFLWRHYKALPERGRIGIHNRSHYEYVLVCKVHPEYNLAERIPGYRHPEAIDQQFWDGRYESIRQFEAHLHRNGTKILKFFLNVSPEEQKARFLERIEDKYKNWKFSASDINERQHWDAYMQAYEDAINETSTAESPWHIIPADRKWFTRLAVGSIITHALEELEPQFPALPKEQQAKLQAYKEQLHRENR